MASYFPDAAADDGERERENKIIIISFHGSLLKKSSTAIKLVFRRNWITEKHTRCVSSSTPAIHRERRGEFPSVDTQLPFDCIVRYMPPLNDYFPFFYGLLRSICSPRRAVWIFILLCRFINWVISRKLRIQLSRPNSQFHRQGLNSWRRMEIKNLFAVKSSHTNLQ